MFCTPKLKGMGSGKEKEGSRESLPFSRFWKWINGIFFIADDKKK